MADTKSDEGLGEILAAIIDLIAADKGNVQLLNPERSTLTIEAQRGFGDDFVDLFREVSAADNSACARALHTHERIVIEDVNEDASFAPFRQIAHDAGFRSFN
jgi:GAF domain-containing protein